MAVGLGACAKQEVPLAPDAIDANVKWFWVNGDAADDTTILDAARKLAVAGKADSRTMPFKGQHRERLTPEELAPVGLQMNDPSKARGLLVVNLFDCRLDVLQDILAATDQSTLYPDVYLSNVRTFSNDHDGYLGKQQQTLDWRSDIAIEFPVGDNYTSVVGGSLRRIPAPADGTFPSDIVLARTWLTAPAQFSAESTSYFRQDYQMEIFWEQTPGKIFHAYGMWREVAVGGFNITLEDDQFFTLMLNNLVDWDTTTSKLCAKR